MSAWYSRIGDGLAYIPAIAAFVALIAGLRAWYRRTLGRRHDRYERLRRLGTNAHLTFFTSVLGEPPAMHRSLTSNVRVLPEGADEFVLEKRTYVESVWIDRDYYVQTFSDQDLSVVAFSVTTRSLRFRPTLRSPGAFLVERNWLERLLRLPQSRPSFVIRLGSSRFGDLDQPVKAAAWLGAHNMHYYEAHWYGNPGNYQWYVFGINDAGAMAFDAPLIGTLMPPDGPLDFAWGFSEDDPEFQQVLGWSEFRQRGRINTYTVIGPTLMLEDYPTAGNLRDYPLSFGPNSSQVRTLP